MKYSIIIPHFNDPERLERLLRTIPFDRSDLEVLVVDDYSPDQAALEAVKSRWPMVRWLSTQQNAGAGAARNVGLANALGARLVFADSDDEFLPGAFDVFEDHVGDDDELVYFLAEAVQEVDGSPSNRAVRANELCASHLESLTAASLERLQLGHVVPWAKVYSRRFVEKCGVKFDETRVSNDVAFNVLASVQAENIRVVPVAVYRVFRREGSLTVDEGVPSMLERLRVLSRLNHQLVALQVPGRMHAGGFLYRALRKGPRAFAAVFRETLAGGLLWPTIRRLSFGEVLGFLHRNRQGRRERSRM